MIERLLHRLDLMSRRERLLLSILALGGLPLVVIFAVILPLVEAQRDANLAAKNTEALHKWVISQAGALPPEALQTSPEPEVGAGPIGISRLEQSLVAVGLRQHAERLSNRSQSGVEIGFDLVPFDGLVGWLQSVSGNWGYTITELRIERTDKPGHVSAALLLEARR